MAENEQPQLPPAFQKFQQQLKADRKKLMREEAYGKNPDQLRAFIGTHMYQRVDELVQLMGLALFDTYSLAVSTESQVQRLRAVHGKALEKLGANVGDEVDELPGVSPDVLDEFQQHFYALGTLLQKKLPDDEEMQKAYNKCAEVLGDMVAELLGEEDEDEGDEEGDDDEDEDDEEGDDDKKPETKPEAESTEPKE